MQVITEQELVQAWKLTTPKELRVFKRMLNPNLPKKVCPTCFDPRDVIAIGGAYKFYFDIETHRPRVLRKAS